ncbi:MAG: 30S ribosomal protein S6 [bacterium]|nr:30S ribosomal protein S6 [bacterium]
MPKQSERIYEFFYLASPDLDEAGFSSLKKGIDARIVEAGGSIREEQSPARHRLAYPVAGKQNAYVVSQYVMLSPEGKTMVTKEFPLNTHILRYMVTALDEKMLTRLRERKFVPQKEKSARRVQATYTPPEKPTEEKKADIAEIERKLDEILGREL